MKQMFRSVYPMSMLTQINLCLHQVICKVEQNWIVKQKMNGCNTHSG